MNQSRFHNLPRRLKHDNRTASQHQPFQRGLVNRVRKRKVQGWKTPLYPQDHLESLEGAIGLPTYDESDIGPFARAGHRAGAIEFQPPSHAERASDFLPAGATPPGWTSGRLIANAVRA
jgi:hypothetical protein